MEKGKEEESKSKARRKGWNNILMKFKEERRKEKNGGMEGKALYF